MVFVSVAVARSIATRASSQDEVDGLTAGKGLDGWRGVVITGLLIQFCSLQDA